MQRNIPLKRKIVRSSYERGDCVFKFMEAWTLHLVSQHYIMAKNEPDRQENLQLVALRRMFMREKQLEMTIKNMWTGSDA